MRGFFFPLLVVLALSAGAVPAGAQSAAPAASETPAAQAAKPDAAPQAATPTSPAVPAPGSVTGGVAPGEPAPASSGPSAPDSKETVQGTGSSLVPHDLSPYGMFMNADIVVKVVMVSLAFASFVTWTIMLVKLFELFVARSAAGKALNSLAEAHTLHEAVDRLGHPKAIVPRLAQAALAEAQRSSGLGAEGVKERATALLARMEARAGRTMGRGTGILATIGSTAPFVGLFGTVWGIMNSFIGISKTNTTNLAVVAPGIAEALLATAFGLVAAIPAVIIYNMFARGITGYRTVLGDAGTEVLRLLSRDLDRQAGPNGVVSMSRRAAE